MTLASALRPHAFALVSLCTLTACAAGGRPEPRNLPPSPLFISPAGEPFRAVGPGADPLADWFAAADASHDGRIDRQELAADAGRFFARLDTDGNGRIDVAENNRYEHTVAPELIGERSILQQPERSLGDGGEQVPRGPGGGRRLMGGGGPGGGDQRAALMGATPYGITGEPQPVRAADTDFSQSVSRAEFNSHAEALFARLDQDHDGGLQLAELSAARSRVATAARQAGRPGGGPGGRGGPGGGGRPR